MNVCTLYPPSHRQLSGDVIGSVKQHAWLSYDYMEESYDENVITGSGFQQQHGRLQLYEGVPEEHSTVAPGGAYNVLHGGTPKPISISKTRWGSSSKDTVPTSCRTPGAKQNEGRAAASLARQREKRRLRQIRYRKKKYALWAHLEEDAKQLREEVQSLQQRQRDIFANLPIRMSVWDSALRYFELFRFGLQASSLKLQSSTTAQPQSSDQLDFVFITMVPDVEHNAGRGVEMMMRSWWGLSRWFDQFDLELEGLLKGDACSMDATTTTSATITEQTLRNVFPALWANKNNAKCKRSALATKLLGQRIVMRGSVHFQLDNANGRVTNLMAQSDMLTSMLHLLGDLQDVSCAFEKALISPDFHWKLAI